MSKKRRNYDLKLGRGGGYVYSLGMSETEDLDQGVRSLDFKRRKYRDSTGDPEDVVVLWRRFLLVVRGPVGL